MKKIMDSFLILTYSTMIAIVTGVLLQNLILLFLGLGGLSICLYITVMDKGDHLVIKKDIGVNHDRKKN